jgi:antitoxin HicB
LERMSDEALSVKEKIAWQLADAMRERGISKNRMAAMLGTSRTQVDRLLNPKDDITLGSLERAAAVAGRRVVIELMGGRGVERRVGVGQSHVSRDKAAPDMGHPEVEGTEESGWLG